MFCVAIEAAVACPSCKSTAPIGDLPAEHACASCGERSPVDWDALFEVTYRGQQVSLLDLLPASKVGERYRGARHASFEVAEPRCACGAVIPETQITRVHFRTTTIDCASCAAKIPARLVRDAPRTSNLGDRVRYVIGARPVDAVATTGRVDRCGGCGAPLPAGSRECRYCHVVTASSADAPALGPRFYALIRLE